MNLLGALSTATEQSRLASDAVVARRKVQAKRRLAGQSALAQQTQQAGAILHPRMHAAAEAKQAAYAAAIIRRHA